MIAVDSCKSYKRFFKRLSSKPKFKIRRKAKPSFYSDNGKLKVKKNAVNIEKVGRVKNKPNFISLNTKYSNSRISFAALYCDISVGIEKELPKVELTNEIKAKLVGNMK